MMIKRFACILIAALLLSQTDPGFAAQPGPTPEPQPVASGGVPVHLWPSRGLPAQAWMDDFIASAEAQGIPLSPDCFENITHWERDGYTDRMYRLEAGGAEVFVQVFDEETITQVVVYLLGEDMESEEMARAMAEFFPLVVRACIAACEEEESELTLDTILTLLNIDVSGMVRTWEDTYTIIRPIRTQYTLECDAAIRWITFSCRWSR